MSRICSSSQPGPIGSEGSAGLRSASRTVSSKAWVSPSSTSSVSCPNSTRLAAASAIAASSATSRRASWASGAHSHAAPRLLRAAGEVWFIGGPRRRPRAKIMGGASPGWIVDSSALDCAGIVAWSEVPDAVGLGSCDPSRHYSSAPGTRGASARPRGSTRWCAASAARNARASSTRSSAVRNVPSASARPWERNRSRRS